MRSHGVASEQEIASEGPSVTFEGQRRQGPTIVSYLEVYVSVAKDRKRDREKSPPLVPNSSER